MGVARVCGDRRDGGGRAGTKAPGAGTKPGWAGREAGKRCPFAADFQAGHAIGGRPGVIGGYGSAPPSHLETGPRMIETTHRTKTMLLISLFAWMASPGAPAQSAPPPDAPASLNLQLPPQPAGENHEAKERSDLNGKAQAELRQEMRRGVPRMRFTDPEEQRPSSITTAERQFEAHRNMFDRLPACPTPFGPPQAPTTMSPERQQPRCRTWRKSRNGWQDSP